MSEQNDIAATLAELDRLHEAATPGPWRASDDAPDDVVLWAAREDGDKRFLANVGGDNPSEVGVAFDIDTHNANLIATLRNAYPLLRAHIATLTAERDELKAWKERAINYGICDTGDTYSVEWEANPEKLIHDVACFAVDVDRYFAALASPAKEGTE